MTIEEITRAGRNLAFAALVAGLALASIGCDQDGNQIPGDTAVEGDTSDDTSPDTEPGDTIDDPVDEDTGGDDATDVPSETVDDPPEPGTYTESLVVDGITRTYVINVPVTAVTAMAEGRVPFLIGLHGAGDTGSNFISATRLTDTAASNAFVVAGPDGWGRGWFVQASEGWPGTDGNETSTENDMSFMLDLIDVAYETYGIDRNRIYPVGHSRGAGLTALLAIGSGRFTTTHGLYVSPFAAYAVNAGYDPYSGTMGYSADPKRPVWVIHGTADGVVPFSMGESLADGLEGGGWDVTFTSISGGDHTWLFQSAYGYSNQDLWDFFAANPLP